MRVEKEYIFNDIKATLFYWNNKYLMKFELGGLEQTYKFSELDYSLDEIEDLLNDNFIKNVKDVFALMNQNMRSGLK